MSQQTAPASTSAGPELRALARREGYRLTLQRRLVLDALGEMSGHSTPDRIFERVQVKSPGISRATVYRTLTFLLKLGLVTVAQIKDNATVYELASDPPHHHLVCQGCDEVIEVRHEVVQPLFSRLEREFGFRVRTDHLMLFGLCERCRRTRRSGS